MRRSCARCPLKTFEIRTDPKHPGFVVVVGGVADVSSEIEDFGAGQQHPLEVGVVGHVAHDVGRDPIPLGGDTGFVGVAGVGVGGEGDQDGGFLPAALVRR